MDRQVGNQNNIFEIWVLITKVRSESSAEPANSMQSHHGLHCLHTQIMEVQFSPLIMLCLGSIRIDHVISGPCCKGNILQGN